MAAMDDKTDCKDMAQRIRELEGLTRELESVKEALKAAEEKYRILVENANDAIFVLQDGRVKFANPKALQMAGVLLDELKKSSYTEYLHPEEKNMVMERHEKRLMGEKILNMYPLRIINREGEVVWTEVNAVRIAWENRPATLNIIRDITSQKLVETRFQQTESLATLRTLAGGLAHSFNNLLMGIMGRVSLLQRVTRPEDRQYEHLQGIESCVEEASRLTKQMLGFAQSGKYHVTRVRLDQVVESVMQTFRRSQKEITFQKVCQKGLWPVEADRNQIELVLMNILLNAWQAIHGPGKVVVKIENYELAEGRLRLQNIRSGRCAKLSVRDTGVGMDETVRKRVFEPFFTTKPIGSHRGLGLSAVYGIVANHNGVVDIESIPGSGTTVSIYLPALAE